MATKATPMSIKELKMLNEKVESLTNNQNIQESLKPFCKLKWRAITKMLKTTNNRVMASNQLINNLMELQIVLETAKSRCGHLIHVMNIIKRQAVAKQFGKSVRIIAGGSKS